MTFVQTFLLASCVALTACATPNGAGGSGDVDEGVVPAADDLVSSGHEVAATHCANCHAIDAGRESPLREAPSFHGILARYASDRLADDLIEGVRVGHDQMPVFDLDVQSADALIAYLEWLDRSAPAHPPQ